MEHRPVRPQNSFSKPAALPCTAACLQLFTLRFYLEISSPGDSGSSVWLCGVCYSACLAITQDRLNCS